MPTIDILLATYNGEEFIDEQIKSIVSQTFQNWQLIIHDDGSTDQTVNLIHKWQKSDNRIKLVEDNIALHSSAANFMHLLEFAQSPFIMFCDQDDVWLDNKIQLMYDIISRKDNTKPQVVYTNALIWHGDDNFSGSIPFWHPKRLQDTLFLNGGIHGCLSLFNFKVLEIMKSQNYIPAMHDHLLILTGLTFGEVTYMKETLVKFRRHSQAVTNGTEIKKTPLASLLNKASFPVIDNDHYESVMNFYDRNRNELSKEQLRLFETYLKMPTMSLLKKELKVMCCNFTLGGSRFELLIKILTRRYI
ncbi:MAG: glycosyltransferase [Bacteroidales bacterium]|jgi:rhamnosyltransferase|nr:glycosyltransferase [Bacteroidales bacterium]